MHRSVQVAVLLLLASFCPLRGAEPEKGEPAFPLKKIDHDWFQLGEVRFSKTKSLVEFPAVVNMNEGPIEYFLVNSVGKLHESVLRTEVDALHIHLAVLFLSTNTAPAEMPPPSALTNAPVKIFVVEKSKKPVPAESMVFRIDTRKTMAGGPWKYTGSRVVGGVFLARRDGSIIAVMQDPDALVNSGRTDAENDEIWTAHKPNIPARETEVVVRIELLPASNVKPRS